MANNVVGSEDFDTEEYNSRENEFVSFSQEQFTELLLRSSRNFPLEEQHQATATPQSYAGIAPTTPQVTDAEDTARHVSQDKNMLLTQLMELVRSRPCLWNTSNRSFKEKPKKDEAWRQISYQLGVTGESFEFEF